MSSFDEYVESINDISYEYGIEVYNNHGTLGVITDISEYGDYPPTITFEVELYSDGETNYTSFLPVIEFPTLDSSELIGKTIYYILERWVKLGAWVNEMSRRPFEQDLNSEYDEGDF